MKRYARATPKGVCRYCLAELYTAANPVGRPRVHCEDDECKRMQKTAEARDRRARVALEQGREPRRRRNQAELAEASGAREIFNQAL